MKVWPYEYCWWFTDFSKKSVPLYDIVIRLRNFTEKKMLFVGSITQMFKASWLDVMNNIEHTKKGLRLIIY